MFFITIDKGFEFEVNLKRLSFGIIIVQVKRNRVEHYRPIFPLLLDSAARVKAGEVIHVRATPPLDAIPASPTSQCKECLTPAPRSRGVIRLLTRSVARLLDQLLLGLRVHEFPPHVSARVIPRLQRFGLPRSRFIESHVRLVI